MRKALALIVLTVLGASGAAYWYGGLGSGAAVQFRTVELERGDVVVNVTATGMVEPEEVVDVGAQVVGRISRFGPDPDDPAKLIDFGSHVEKGTLLARIDDATFQSAVKVAQADLKRAEAELGRSQARLKQTTRDWKRAQQLESSRSVSESERDLVEAQYEMARAELHVAEAGVQSAEAMLQQAEVNLEYTTIESPIDGIVIDRRVNVGQTVITGLHAPSLFLIAKDLDRMHVSASVNEADIGRIRLGQPVLFTVDAYPDLEFRGVVEQIRLNATLAQNVVTYNVMVGCDNSEGSLLPYMTASLRFEVACSKQAILVPNLALRWKPDATHLAGGDAERLREPRTGAAQLDRKGILWVDAGGGTVRPVDVQLGLSDDVMTEILATDLQPGTKIVSGVVRETEGGFSAAFVPKQPNRWNKRSE